MAVVPGVSMDGGAVDATPEAKGVFIFEMFIAVFLSIQSHAANGFCQ